MAGGPSSSRHTREPAAILVGMKYRTRCGRLGRMLLGSVALLACREKAGELQPAPLAALAPRTKAAATIAQPHVEATEPATLGVLYERVLPESRGDRPLFGPGQSVTAGAHSWDQAGRYLGPNRWTVGGNARVVAMVGTSRTPMMMAQVWPGAEPAWAPRGAPHDDETSYLVTAGAMARQPTMSVRVGAEFRPDAAMPTVAPDATRIALREGQFIRVRSVATGAVVASATIALVDEASDDQGHEVCWSNNSSVAWVERAADGIVLRTLPLQTKRKTVAPPQPTMLSARLQGEELPSMACDPGGGAMALLTNNGELAVFDLANNLEVASMNVGTAEHLSIAIGARGISLVVAREQHVTVYQRDGRTLRSVFARAWPLESVGDLNVDKLQLQFSNDGARLAVVAKTLVVLGPVAQAPSLTAPSDIAFVMPQGFADASPRVAPDDDTSQVYGQVTTPTGLSILPHLVLHAVGEGRNTGDVVAVVLDAREFAGKVPAANANDAAVAPHHNLPAHPVARWIDWTDDR